MPNDTKLNLIRRKVRIDHIINRFPIAYAYTYSRIFK